MKTSSTSSRKKGTSQLLGHRFHNLRLFSLRFHNIKIVQLKILEPLFLLTQHQQVSYGCQPEALQSKTFRPKASQPKTLQSKTFQSKK